VPSPKRSAPRRTAAALAEDLVQARKVGGIRAASEADLVATLDFLSVAGVSPLETPLARARDLLTSYVRRGCEHHEQRYEHDKTAIAAAVSLRVLLLRPDTDRRMAETIRRDAAKAAGQSVSPDAVRHREDGIIHMIAQEIFADLQVRQRNEPQTVEAAIHRLVPIASDLRQDLHDLLCVTYMGVAPKSPRERRVIEGTFREVVINLGRLLVATGQLAAIGIRTANMTEAEYSFVNRARHVNALLFADSDDREFMINLLNPAGPDTGEPAIERMLASQHGKEVYGRLIDWMRSCFATCAFERTTELHLMCEPHELVTQLYDMEIAYTQQGFSDLNIPGNIPVLHHRIVNEIGRKGLLESINQPPAKFRRPRHLNYSQIRQLIYNRKR
jgi:hypothetical protein